MSCHNVRSGLFIIIITCNISDFFYSQNALKKNYDEDGFLDKFQIQPIERKKEYFQSTLYFLMNDLAHKIIAKHFTSEGLVNTD